MAELRSLVPDLAERETWACGPAGLLDRIESYWTDLESGHRLHTERFRSKLAEPGDGGTVEFTAGGITVDCAGTSSILEAGEASGVLLPSGCRMRSSASSSGVTEVRKSRTSATWPARTSSTSVNSGVPVTNTDMSPPSVSYSELGCPIG